MTRASSSFALVLVAMALLSTTRLAAAQAASAQVAADPARTPDATFVAKAAEVMALDSDLATLAAARATSADVKALAKRVLAARTAIASDLESMAGGRQIVTPSMPPRPEPAALPASPVAALKTQSRAGFDAAFLAALLANGEAAVAMFDAESRDGRDAEIKEWAARQLPALREHLTAIRTLRPRPGS